MRGAAGLTDAAIKARQTEACVTAVMKALTRLVRDQCPEAKVEATMRPVRQDDMAAGFGFKFEPTELTLRVPGWALEMTFEPALPVGLPAPRRLTMEVDGDC